MFEKELSQKLKDIFKVKKVSFAIPGSSKEQETLFVEITRSNNKIKDGKALAYVEGNAVLFGNADKLPFGYFQKRIAQSDPDLTKDLFFFDIENNTRIFENIVERSFSFAYFFSSQYDPEMGSITSIEITEG